MNQDELKMVLDAIMQLGETGADAFVWWLILDKLLPVIGWVLVMGMLCWTMLLIAARTIGQDAAIRYLRDRWDYGAGYLTVSAHERGRVLRRLNELERKV